MPVADSEPKTPAIDPTLNVKEANAMAAAAAEKLRQADLRFYNMLIDKDREFSVAMRGADRRRQDDMSAQKDRFDQQLATTLRLQVENNATLFLTQMDKGFAALNVRVSELERKQYENAGKGQGNRDVFAYILAFISSAVAVTTVALSLMRAH